MTGSREIALDGWRGAEAFRLFRGYGKPHYAVTSRVDVTRLMSARERLGVFRCCLWAIGAGLHAVPELRMRFRGDRVTLHDRIELSPAIALEGGGFGYAYIPWDADRASFDTTARERIAAVRAGAALDANTGVRDDVAYLSCLPWLDYTSLDNALPGPDDCIPRVSWGKIVPRDGGHDMAMTIEVHHALVHGEHVGRYFSEVQAAFDRV